VTTDPRLQTAGDALNVLSTVADLAAPLAPAGPWQSALRIASAALTAGSRLLYSGASDFDSVQIFTRLGDDYAAQRAAALRRAAEIERK